MDAFDEMVLYKDLSKGSIISSFNHEENLLLLWFRGQDDDRNNGFLQRCTAMCFYIRLAAPLEFHLLSFRLSCVTG